MRLPSREPGFDLTNSLHRSGTVTMPIFYRPLPHPLHSRTASSDRFRSHPVTNSRR